MLNPGHDIEGENREVRLIVRANRYNASNLEQEFVQMVPRGRYIRSGPMSGSNRKPDRESDTRTFSRIG